MYHMRNFCCFNLFFFNTTILYWQQSFYLFQFVNSGLLKVHENLNILVRNWSICFAWQTTKQQVIHPTDTSSMKSSIDFNVLLLGMYELETSRTSTRYLKTIFLGRHWQQAFPLHSHKAESSHHWKLKTVAVTALLYNMHLKSTEFPPHPNYALVTSSAM